MEAENKKAVRVSVAIVCVLLGWILNRGFIYVANMAGVRNVPVFDIFPASALISVAIVAALFAYVMANAEAMTFGSEVVGEFKKIVWPTKKETTASTIVVIILVLITALVIWAFDLLWSTLLKLII